MSQTRTIWTIKVGSAILADAKSPNGIDARCVKNLVKGIGFLCEQGVQPVLVSSGSVACGMPLLGLKQRPRKLQLQQAAAAVGQSVLMHTYSEAFAPLGKRVAQLLLTPTDRNNRERYLNIRNTLENLLKHDIIPIVNENDTVATDELRFGDNDRLAAMVADLAGASHLVLLTDCDGLFNTNPHGNPDASLIEQASTDDAQLDSMALPGDTSLGRGGMHTKLQAARQAALAGIVTYIGNGHNPDILEQMHRNTGRFTQLRGSGRIASRKRWLATAEDKGGILHLDEGASKQLLHAGASLLPRGISNVSGSFKQGDIVQCYDCQGQLIARGMVNHSSAALRRALKARPESAKLEPVETIHRDHLVLITQPTTR